MPIIDPDWTTPIEMTFDPGKSIRSDQGLMLAGNPIAMAQGKPGAPYIQAIWHPYNGAVVGDGFDGRIWSFAIDGAVTAFETPDFLDGYEYRLSCFDISHNNAVSSSDIQYQLRRQSGAGLNTATTIATLSNGASVASFNIELTQPRRASASQIVNNEPVSLGAVTKVKNIRISVPDVAPGVSANIDGGAAYLYRRRVYA